MCEQHVVVRNGHVEAVLQGEEALEPKLQLPAWLAAPHNSGRPLVEKYTFQCVPEKDV